MPQPSHANSSTKSKPASKGSAQSATESAKQAFAAASNLSLTPENSSVPPEQEGRKRLPNSYMIASSRIIPDPDQPRQHFDEASMQELMASIDERGIKQPLTIRWNPEAEKYMVIDGGRRFEAATRLKLSELPCWVQEGDNREVLIDQIVHNWQRVDLRPIETADALARLRDEYGVKKQTDLSRVTGKPKSEISKLLALHDKVEPTVQQMARDDSEAKLTKRHLYNISKLKPENQKEIAARVRSENLTAQQTEQIIKEASPKLSIGREQGLAARQRRFKTSQAEVVITFRQKNITTTDIQDVVSELSQQIA